MTTVIQHLEDVSFFRVAFVGKLRSGAKRILLLALTLISLAGFSQSTLRGKVIDGKGNPIPGTNVFFAHTTLGAATSENGGFEITKIPNGKFDLTVSMIGYRRFKHSMEFNNSEYEFVVVLDEDAVSLGEVTVRADQSDLKYYPVFEKNFLGSTKNANHCTVKNPKEVHLYYDEKTKILTAHASNPILIENKSLGYRIYYILDRFELDNKAFTRVVEGVVRFEELPLTGRSDSIVRANKRRRAYKGSLRHFMIALYNNSVKEDGFIVAKVNPKEFDDANKWNAEYPINLNEHISGSSVKHFAFMGTLRVEYRGEYNPPEYASMGNRNRSYQTSFLEFRQDTTDIFENGYFVEQLSVDLYGFLGWAETIGEMLPLSYQPPRKKGS